MTSIFLSLLFHSSLVAYSAQDASYRSFQLRCAHYLSLHLFQKIHFLDYGHFCKFYPAIMRTKRKPPMHTKLEGRPMKKRTATTAGRGAEGETVAVSNGRTNNSQNVSQAPYLPINFRCLEFPFPAIRVFLHLH